ncbi:hypothetical protein [Nocardioides acrostichi]|uniref:Uncharacterized protein n=1 Tax=Nocardioides acrostichi TaxID=2784339 RepID=A0A930YDP4_9ACTN|nr:hypothetical protein [Nocardioides acrostichi]MBF4162669.1 hypothetical protein [Nocardioides acrostichi]
MSRPPFSSPGSAPRRTDLPFLLTRSRRRPTPVPDPAPAAPPAQPSPAASSSLDLSSPSAPPGEPAPPPAAAPVSSLDLSTASDPAPAPPSATVSSSLDLSSSEPADAPSSEPSAGRATSLDLSAPASDDEPTPPPPSTPAPPPGPGPVRGVTERVVVRAGDRFVRLSRLQSAIGSLTIEAMCSPAVGDLQLGAAWRLKDGDTGVLRRDPQRGTPAHAPAGSARPVAAVTRAQYETLTLDLRQVRDLDTVLVFGLGGTPAPLAWGGTVAVTTYAGARVEIPLDAEPSGGVMPLLTLRQADGWLFVRAERLWPVASLRQACAEFGFAGLTWLDANTPAT